MPTAVLIVAGSILVAAALYVYVRSIEPYWLRVSERKTTSTPAGSVLRVAHLSDLHFHPDDPRRLRCIQRAVRRAVAWRPDLICCTGDFRTARVAFDGSVLAALLRELSDAAPTFAVLGNHDGGAWAARRTRTEGSTEPVTRMLQEAGIQWLDNRSAVVSGPGGTVLRVVGVGDFWAEQMDPVAAYEGVAEEETVLLLSHNPDTKEFLRSFPWRWLLAGHTHGGEGVLFGWAPFTPVRDRRYRLGLKRYDGRWVHVTAGIGTMSGFRFGCRPEVALLTLATTQGAERGSGLPR